MTSPDALAAALRGRNSADDPVTLRQAVVTAVTGTGPFTATIRLGGGTVDVPGVACLDWYRPTVGATVWALRSGGALLIVGPVGGNGVAGPPGPEGPAGPAGAAGTSVQLSPKARSTEFYSGEQGTQGSAGIQWAYLTAHPIIVHESVTIAALACRLITVSGSAQLLLGLYTSVDGLPAARIAHCAGVSSGSTGLKVAALIGGNVTLQPGLYWAAMGNTATTGSPTMAGTAPDNRLPLNANNLAANAGVYRTNTISPGTTELPATFPAPTGYLASIPAVAYRLA